MRIIKASRRNPSTISNHGNGKKKTKKIPFGGKKKQLSATKKVYIPDGEGVGGALDGEIHQAGGGEQGPAVAGAVAGKEMAEVDASRRQRPKEFQAGRERVGHGVDGDQGHRGSDEEDHDHRRNSHRPPANGHPRTSCPISGFRPT